MEKLKSYTKSTRWAVPSGRIFYFHIPNLGGALAGARTEFTFII